MRIIERDRVFNRIWDGPVGKYLYKNCTPLHMARRFFHFGFRLGWKVARKRYEKK